VVASTPGVLLCGYIFVILAGGRWMDADELELAKSVAFRRNNKWCFGRIDRCGSRLW
jgi:hypothetical protein